jgi:hypothetical protein
MLEAGKKFGIFHVSGGKKKWDCGQERTRVGKKEQEEGAGAAKEPEDIWSSPKPESRGQGQVVGDLAAVDSGSAFYLVLWSFQSRAETQALVVV